MKAQALIKPGSDFSTCEVPVPAYAPDEFLVQVKACGVCGHDALNKNGAFPRASYPLIMGHEISGVVSQVGSAVKEFELGDSVVLMQKMACGTCHYCRTGHDNLCDKGGFYGEELTGGYGEYVKASARNAMHLPSNISYAQGAILSCALGTGYHALVSSYYFQEADWVLITGASGGVGLHATQVARAFGKRVIAVTRNTATVEGLEAAGAEKVIVSTDLDFSAEVKRASQGGVSLVLEIVGTVALASSIRSVRRNAEIILIGNVEPEAASVNPGLLVLKEISLRGSGHARLRDLADVISLVERGAVHPLVDKTFDMADVNNAFQYMTSPGGAGRIVLTY